MRPAPGGSRSGSGGGLAWFACFGGGALALYLFSPITEWGDSLHYALWIERGVGWRLFETGHLLWRPLGSALWHLALLFDSHARAFGSLRLLNLVISAAGVGLAAVFFRRRLGPAAGAFAAVAVGTGYAWWSYATTACAYPTVATLNLAALMLAWPEPGGRRGPGRLAWAAVVQACSALLWMPGLLNLPVVALAAGLGRDGRRTSWSWGRALGTAALAGALPLAVYVLCWNLFVAPAGVSARAWLGSAAHSQPLGLTAMGAARAAYGWTRLLWQPWRLALDFSLGGWDKLFNARVWWDWGLWKPVAAWLLLAVAFLAGLGARKRGGWTTWLLLLCWCAPHLLLAVLFKGSDPERWLLASVALWTLALRWALGASPSRLRVGACCALLLTVPLLGARDRFGPHGDVEHTPQMRTIREAAPHVRAGDRVYFAGELDEGQLNRTVQTRWSFQWRYFTGASAVDVCTTPGGDSLEPALPGAPPAASGRDFICEQVLAGIPPNTVTVEGADDQRGDLVRRLPQIPPTTAFEAGGQRFYELRRP